VHNDLVTWVMPDTDAIVNLNQGLFRTQDVDRDFVRLPEPHMLQLHYGRKSTMDARDLPPPPQTHGGLLVTPPD